MSAIRRILTLVALAFGVAMGALALSSATASADSGMNWDAIAKCESGGNWGTDTGNGFYGGLQFSPATWTSNGGTGLPHQASREEQIRVAEKVYSTQGAGAWPSCGAGSGTPGLATMVSSTGGSTASGQCQGVGRGPLGLVDWGQVCQVFTDPGKALAGALGFR